MAQPIRQPDASPSAHRVLLCFAGGPRDGDVVEVARSLVSRAIPTWIRHETREAVHVYTARRAWRGEHAITLYHRGAYRVHFPGKKRSEK